MSVLVHHCVIHQLALAGETLNLVPRQSLIATENKVEALIEQLQQAYNNKPAKGVGGFVPPQQGDENEPAGFADLLSQWQDNPDNFLDFSVNASQKFIQALLNFGAPEAGFLVFAHYQHMATEYLLVALLNTKQHVEVSRELELNTATHLDLAKMQLAARVDLTALGVDKDSHRYVSFIKARIGRKVSDFFTDFLDCEEQVDIKQQNKTLVENLDAYLASEALDPLEKHESRAMVSDYYKEKLESGDDVVLSELAEQLPRSEQSEGFEAFVQQQEQSIEPQFQPDKAVLKSLGKFSGQGGGVSLSFERKLLGDRVHYDAMSDTLTIKGLPPNLKDQLSRLK